MDKFIIEVKSPRSAEVTPELMVQFLSSLSNLKKYQFIFLRGVPISLEIAFHDESIHFYIVGDKNYQSFIEAQLLSQYTKALITPCKDYIKNILSAPFPTRVGQLKLKVSDIYPLKTFKDFKDVDPLSSLLGVLSKLGKDDSVIIQLMLVPASASWQNKGFRILSPKSTKYSLEQQFFNKKLVQDKISQQGFKCEIRLLTKSANRALLSLIAASFASLGSPEGNSLKLRRSWIFPEFLIKSIVKRELTFGLRRQILNVSEIATMFHFPGQTLSEIQNISWTKTILSEPPENLPVAANLTDDQKKEVNFFAKTFFKNQLANFGIKKEDRRRHIYIIGKTGTGKSTLIANMAINDIRNGEGLALIDPHGDLAEAILDFIPSYRINDVVYLNPADTQHPFHLNPLEVSDPTQKEIVTSGIVAIFHKLYAHSWGPRLEYILRNVILTLLETPKPTLLDVPKLLTNPKFRSDTSKKLNDQVLRNFWIHEFDQMPPKLKSESISPILNKVGQFISSPMIRNIVGNYKSSIDLEKIMNEGKILIFNLAQGRLGEDNAALLGAMTVTKLQISAMNRVNIPEEDRRDFYLYVDEFQNFATGSFVKILSEARKYRLNLILANQYTAQTTDDIRSAIFGNVGTLISFLVGAEDANYLAREFKERFKEEDLLALNNYQILIKLAIASITSSPFFAQSLPLPQSRTQNREKVIKSSRQRYGSKPNTDNSPQPEIIIPMTPNVKPAQQPHFQQGTIYFSKTLH